MKILKCEFVSIASQQFEVKLCINLKLRIDFSGWMQSSIEKYLGKHNFSSSSSCSLLQSFTSDGVRVLKLD